MRRSLAAKPWTRIQPVRLRLWAARHTPFTRSTPLAVCPPLCSPAPFLQTYERVAFAIEGFRHLLAHLVGEIPGVTDQALSPMERRKAIEGYLAAFPFMQMMHHMCRYKPVVREEAFRELAYGRLFVTVLLAGYGALPFHAGVVPNVALLTALCCCRLHRVRTCSILA